MLVLFTYLNRSKTTSRTRTRCADSWRLSCVTSRSSWRRRRRSLRRKASVSLPNCRQR